MGAAVILIHPRVLACIPLNGRKWLRCRDVPIRCVRPLFNVQIFPNTYRSLLNDGYYFVASVLCGYIRRPIDTTGAPAGTSLHHTSRKSSPARKTSCIAGNAHIAGTGAVVIRIHLFFVDISVGRLNQRTHLPVRPLITHRGKHPPDGNRPSRSQNAEKQRKSGPE